MFSLKKKLEKLLILNFISKMKFIVLIILLVLLHRSNGQYLCSDISNCCQGNSNVRLDESITTIGIMITLFV